MYGRESGATKWKGKECAVAVKFLRSVMAKEQGEAVKEIAGGSVDLALFMPYECGTAARDRAE